jgi:hypothetical protein
MFLMQCTIMVMSSHVLTGRATVHTDPLPAHVWMQLDMPEVDATEPAADHSVAGTTGRFLKPSTSTL